MSSKTKTRERILYAAEEVFAIRGFGGARTAEIAKKASVNKALLHYYFSSKEGLYHAMMDRLLFEMIQIAQDVLKKGLTGKALIDGIFDAFFDYAAKHRHFVRLTTVENSGAQSRYLENMLRNFFKPLFDRACDHLQNEAKKGRLKKIDAPHFLTTVYLAIVGYFSDGKFIGAITGSDISSSKKLAERKSFLKDLIASLIVPAD